MMRALAIGLVLALAGCGFQLRGAADLPYDTLYIPESTHGVALDLKRQIEAGSRTRVVSDPAAAQAQLQFFQEAREKHILSLSGAGRVREYELRYRVGFRVHDGKGGQYLEPVTLELRRDFTFSDALVIAKGEEEQLMYRDMQAELVYLILRRLAGAQPPATR